ncbi:hypothetical protein JXA85_05445, partial [Candidatus Woesearchaeota archaeon]|nr:hypothetical protein [Candidatus Woesearchaeota archaeon]
EVVIKSIPHATEDYNESTDSVVKRFKRIEYFFYDNKVKSPRYRENLSEKAVIPFSCGKDSLLTLAVSNETGLNPAAVYINDTVSPSENRIKLEHTKKVCKEHNIPLVQIRNEVEQLNDFETWGKNETCLGYTHMLTGFSFISLPLMHFYNARYFIPGNEQDMNFSYVNKDGVKTYPSYDQTTIWMKKQDSMINKMIGGKVISLIEPLTNPAIVKILNSRYPDFAKYEVSCDCLDASDEKRWCHNCSKCARLSLLMLAFGFDIGNVGLKRKLLDKKHKKLYTLFDGNEVDCYEKSIESKEEQLLAFYMAYRNKTKGYLIDLFKERFLDTAKEKEDYLYKKFFKIYKSKTMTEKIEKKFISIYREELSGL